jgi:hypothetical protein
MRRLLALLPALVPGPALAQRQDAQLWLQTTATTRLGDDLRLTVEGIGRFSDAAGGFSHDEIGGLLTLAASDTIDVAVGYRHVDDYRNGERLPDEERLRQIVQLGLGGGLAGRLRLEERFSSAGPGMGVRLRPQLRFTRPLASGALALFATHEFYWNLNTTGWGQRAGYERMRNAAGLSVPLAPALRSDIGYLNQWRPGRHGARDQMDHAVTLSLAFTL